MAKSPAPDEILRRLALIQCLWDELQAARKFPATYEALTDRLRRESDAFRQALDPHDPTR